MPLVSGDIAVRQRELAHLVIFTAIVGALLSLALSVAAGRALAGPIGLLRRAAAAVGAGRLRVRLPEEEGGEFGQLFSSFNRMVRRLRRARARERRTARVLAWGEMARQVAHEIKNPLTPIKLSVQHLRRAHQDRHPQFDTILEGSAHEILREIDRLSEIARAFSRYGAPALAAGPLEAVDGRPWARPRCTGGDERNLRGRIRARLPRAQSGSGELKKCCLTCGERATALHEGGRITGSSSGKMLVLSRGQRVRHYAELLPRFRAALLHPPGHGLGLAIVRRLVESWQGTVAVVSRPGEGTTVSVRLRVAATPSTTEGHRTR
jgi:signal transduction histidine kinase